MQGLALALRGRNSTLSRILRQPSIPWSKGGRLLTGHLCGIRHVPVVSLKITDKAIRECRVYEEEDDTQLTAVAASKPNPRHPAALWKDLVDEATNPGLARNELNYHRAAFRPHRIYTMENRLYYARNASEVHKQHTGFVLVVTDEAITRGIFDEKEDGEELVGPQSAFITPRRIRAKSHNTPLRLVPTQIIHHQRNQHLCDHRFLMLQAQPPQPTRRTYTRARQETRWHGTRNAGISTNVDRRPRRGR